MIDRKAVKKYIVTTVLSRGDKTSESDVTDTHVDDVVASMMTAMANASITVVNRVTAVAHTKKMANSITRES